MEFEREGCWAKTKQFFLKCYVFLYDNAFVNEIFPVIKQQKPGKDLYVWICAVQFVMCIYIILFYNKLIGTTGSLGIAEQINSNQFSGDMLVVLFIMIILMVIDRVFYATHMFLSKQDVELRQGADEQL